MKRTWLWSKRKALLPIAALLIACSRRQVAVVAVADAGSHARTEVGQDSSSGRDAGSLTCFVDVYVDSTADRGTVRTELGRAGVQRIPSLSHGHVSLGRSTSDHALFFGRESDGPTEWLAWLVPRGCGDDIDLVPVDGEHVNFCDSSQTDRRACSREADERDGNRERTLRTSSDLWVELLPSAVAVSRSDKRTVATVVRIWSSSNYTSLPVDTERRLRYAAGQKFEDATTRILVRRAHVGAGDELVATELANLYRALAENALLSRELPEDASWLGAWKGLAKARIRGRPGGGGPWN